MKPSVFGMLPVACVAICLATFTASAAAQAAPDIIRVKDIALINSMPSTVQSLSTESMSIATLFALDTAPMAHATQVAEAIPTATSLVPQPLRPADLLRDPNTAWQRLMNQAPPAPKPLDPLEFFKIPGLNSGLKMNVMNF
jgi:hypothetical protein